jgi:hypothetical protein
MFVGMNYGKATAASARDLAGITSGQLDLSVSPPKSRQILDMI